MKTVVLTLAILLGVAANAAATTITYTLNMWGTLNGSNVTNVIILERNGAQTNLDTSASFIISASGTTTLSHDVAFTPTETLILGIDAAPPGGHTHMAFFVDPAFGWSIQGILFSQVFPGVGYSNLRNAILNGSNGDATAQAFLVNFFNGAGAAAAFDSNSAPLFGEFTPFTPVPEPSTFVLVGLGAVAFAARRLRRAR